MTLGPDLLLDADGDLRIEDGDLVLGADLAQAVAIRLRFVRDEWFLNPDIGIPFHDEIFVKGVDLERVRTIYRTEIANTPGIKSVERVDVSLNNETRELTITWSAIGDAGRIEGVV